MHIVDSSKLRTAISDAGYSSIEEVANILNVHRNSVSRYICGAPVLPKVLEQLFSLLNLNASDLLVQDKDSNCFSQNTESLNKLVAAIIAKYPNVGVLLFGSRARGNARKYSDIDLGIVAGQPLEFKVWSDIRDIIDELSQDLPYLIDVVDLGRAEGKFLEEVRRDCKFLGGNPLVVQNFMEKT